MQRHLQLLLLSSNYSCIRYGRGLIRIERNLQKNYTANFTLDKNKAWKFGQID